MPNKNTPKNKVENAKKKRIYEVAREFNLSSVAMVEVIRSLGFEVKNHMAICTIEMANKVQLKFDEERSAVRQEIKRKTIQQKERNAKENVAKKSEIKKSKSPLESKKGMSRKTTEETSRPKRRRRGRSSSNDREILPIVEQIGEIPKKPPVNKPSPSSGSPEGSSSTQGASGRSRKRRRRRPTVDQKEVQESIRKTMAKMSAGVARTRRSRRQDEEETPDENTENQVLKVNEFTTVGELAAQMDVRPTEAITVCLQMGLMVTINQRLDMDTITLVADEFGFGVEELEEIAVEMVIEEHADAESDLKPRPPVVTIMGHVDHGKTSLLDYIRNTNVVAGEAGGITQHIGAYHVELKDGQRISFLDTPGHEAFTAMRARGASVTDVVVLIIAADDNVMPQTIEAIDHARAANVPIVVAINKIDLPTADVDKIKRQLSEHNVLVEQYGGSVQSCEISAETGHNIDVLLEILALETEILDLKANPNKHAKGTIIESKLEQGRGNVATVLIQEGTLRIGVPFVSGQFSGRVRAMLDERGQKIEEAGPSRPIQVLGLEGLPQAGDTFNMLENYRQAREISQKRQQLRREQDFHRIKRVSLADIHQQIQAGKLKELRLILKGDVDGSVEALQDALTQISHEEVQLNIIHRGVGAISESDILLATASDAVIIGFNVRPDGRARKVAVQETVDIRLYRVIYEAVEDVRASLTGLLAPKIEEEFLGSAEIRELFQVPRIGVIAGCFISDGVISRNSQIRVLRDNVVIYEGTIGSLRRFKDDVREVQSGFECGIAVENFNDVKIGDILEAYQLVETERTF